MLKQAVILASWSGLEAERPRDGAAWLTPLADNVARHGISEILLIGAQGPVPDRHFAGPGSSGREPGSPPPHPYRLEQPPVRAMSGDASALAALRPRLDERFLLVDAGTFLDINYLDLLIVGGEAMMTVAGHPDLAEGSWGAAAVMRREALDGIDSDGGFTLAGDLVPRLAAAGRLARRCYRRPLVAVEEPDAIGKIGRLMTRPAVFLDRDGVLNVDREYVSRIDQFAWIAGAREAVKAINDAGWYAFVVTNQSGVARGLYPEDAIAVLHDHMAAELQAAGAFVDRIEYCPYHDEGTIPAYRRASSRRKPGPGMLLACFDALPVDRARSFLIGDKATDIAAAEAAGIPGHLFSGGSLLQFLMPLLAERGVAG